MLSLTGILNLGALMVGVPAKQIGWMSEYGEQLKLPLDSNGDAQCSKLVKTTY